MKRREFLADGLAAAAGLGAVSAAPGPSGSALPLVAVLAELRFSSGTGDEAAHALRELAAATRTECGCRRYMAARDLDNPDLFHLSELWNDLGALADHFATPHMATFSARARALGYAAPFLKQIRIAELTDLKPAQLRLLRNAGCPPQRNEQER